MEGSRSSSSCYLDIFRFPSCETLSHLIRRTSVFLLLNVVFEVPHKNSIFYVPLQERYQSLKNFLFKFLCCTCYRGPRHVTPPRPIFDKFSRVERFIRCLRRGKGKVG